ncbi:E3 ubiquitin-protein ligase TRAIP [Latimeria chalumnae]|uniref:E3 ubiquitin-protein ligase TRAIP n=1 Tax=Latimeria chalumnae TaxID=7897 RepID=UPI0003C111EB|nr:PREDICTED: E3 ubiquitin-protein ligase TRAIP isoform X1 [Latimeria chalumnae]XP_014347947.1 PREDICTED: E3 ubiquitin-protein ligase TRAIP isoform X1 [Latimeria chalumnae]|eukprot:XP_006002702.1 PREDICTED: E3 ubiquitin-protein ligase TRAIP isoform X1 [Latimeria chalumnae]
MPIRAYCTICSDFFDNTRDVAAIHCGHTFHYECLIQWFQSAPCRTCPQCRIQVTTRHIISKLFFDVGVEEEVAPDAESLQNELDRVKAQLSVKEKEKRECQSIVDTVRDTLDNRNATIESLRRELGETDTLCSTLKKQLKYLEQQQDGAKSAKEEARKLRNKMKSMESIEVLLQGQRAEVEEMIRDMGVGPLAVEQLSIYCVSLKKEYENLKEARKNSSEMTEKLKRELFASNNKLQKSLSELNKVKEELQAAQEEVRSADKEITSLKKKVEFLQKALSSPTRTNEAISRLVFESPAPLELQKPCLHRPANSDCIDLDVAFNVDTPEHVAQKSIFVPAKKKKLDAENPGMTSQSTSAPVLQARKTNQKLTKAEKELPVPLLFRNSMLFSKNCFGSLLEPHKNSGTVRMGFDGLGGRTKFIQPTSLTEIRPLATSLKRKKVSRLVPVSLSTQPKLDEFLK